MGGSRPFWFFVSACTNGHLLGFCFYIMEFAVSIVIIVMSHCHGSYY